MIKLPKVTVYRSLKWSFEDINFVMSWTQKANDIEVTVTESQDTEPTSYVFTVNNARALKQLQQGTMKDTKFHSIEATEPIKITVAKEVKK
mgnify:CR=1 FL=1